MTTLLSGNALRLRTSARGALAFSLLFLAHHLLQGLGPASDSPATVAAFDEHHRSALLASEVAIGLALLAFVAFLAPLVVMIWRAGCESVAVALIVSGAVFIAMGFASTAAETALVAVSRDGHLDAVAALNQLQGRTPVVWAAAAVAATVGLSIRRTGLLWRWLGTTSLVLAAVFLLAGVSSLIGTGVEGGYSLIGVGLLIAWTLLLSTALWRASSDTTALRG